MKGWKDCPDCWGSGHYRGFGKACESTPKFNEDDLENYVEEHYIDLGQKDSEFRKEFDDEIQLIGYEEALRKLVGRHIRRSLVGKGIKIA